MHLSATIARIPCAPIPREHPRCPPVARADELDDLVCRASKVSSEIREYRRRGSDTTVTAAHVRSRADVNCFCRDPPTPRSPDSGLLPPAAPLVRVVGLAFRRGSLARSKSRAVGGASRGLPVAFRFFRAAWPLRTRTAGLAQLDRNHERPGLVKDRVSRKFKSARPVPERRSAIRGPA